MACGGSLAPLGTAARRPVERKVITALFCDVVGSTEMGERLDPEDVDRLLRHYHTLARGRIEAHGGVVEKFIGDAVVGVFGVPTGHEDDATRAIRASLAIVREVAASGMGIQVRVGVHTGEALVRVGDDRSPEEGFATGDCLNTAARLQGIAAPGGVIVGDTTYRLAAQQFAWKDHGPAELKGKASPVRAWEPVSERVDQDTGHDEATAFVGRADELRRLTSAFERAVSARSVEIVTIVGEPGMGKSRLLRELEQHLLAHRRITWRRGRCLPYGEGVSFWALGEIVKSHAGIREGDDQATTSARLAAAIHDPDPALSSWMRERIAPLVGLQTHAAPPPPQEELFAAWRRFIGSLVDDPVVLVIEDLHWADAALVAFLASLADAPMRGPLLLLVTARPEVAERHPTWLGRATGDEVLQLVSLDDGAIRAMVEEALAGVSEALVETVLDRAGGSPLYAEQLAAFVRERGLSEADATLTASVIPLTIRALLAARIDALPPQLKPTILDASVVGRIFWTGAVASVAHEDPALIDPALVEITRLELARILAPSTMRDETEYGFWHALLRDVAYAALPRAARLEKHRAAAAWIVSKASGQLGELAEIVADHLEHALQLARDSGASEDEHAVAADLATAVLAAADHAMHVHPDRAVSHINRAIELLEADDGRRAKALATLGTAHLAVAAYADAIDALDAAHAAYLAAGDAVAAAELALPRHTARRQAGETADGMVILDEARPILEAARGSGLVEHLAYRARIGEQDAAQSLALADEAIALADELGIPHPVRALYARGMIRLEAGDRSGELEVRDGIRRALEVGDLRQAAVGLANIAQLLPDVATPTAALAASDEAIAFAKDHGLSDAGLRSSRLDALDLGGQWDEALAEARALRDTAQANGDAWTALMCEMTMASILTRRGAPLEGEARWMGDEARAVGLPAYVGMQYNAMTAIEADDDEGVRQTVAMILAAVPPGETIVGAVDLIWCLTRTADLDLGHEVLAKAVPEGPSSRGHLTLMAAARLAQADGDVAGANDRFARAAAFFEAHEWAWESAFALAGRGSTAAQLGRSEEGRDALERARALAMRLRTAPLLQEIDAALATLDTSD